MNGSLKQAAQSIFQAALDAADPAPAVARFLRRDGETLWAADRAYDLHSLRRVVVIGFGKAGAAIGQGVERVLGERIDAGWINVKYEHLLPLRKIHLHEAGHPLLDENTLLGTRRILALLDELTENDLVLCLISGGGSALLELPVEGVSLGDLRAATDAMLRCGATINELNTLRKHLSQVKGGQLARRAKGARVISLILSDVIGSPLDIIASGPTVPDSGSFAEALEVVRRYNIIEELPQAVWNHLLAGEAGKLPDTPKAGDPIFARVQNLVIADNILACEAALRAAENLGFQPLLLSSFLQGEAREVARVFGAVAREILSSNRPIPRPACVLAGGETTVTLRGKGKGGRNQEMALAAAIELAGLPDVAFLSGGTDGSDGPTDAAGAYADSTTLARASALGLSARAFLAENDSYHFFQSLGDLLMTGPTNTNVNDISFLLVS
jgi:hydroxypyruvate reductase